MIWNIILVYIVWTILAVVLTIMNIGNKHRRGKVRDAIDWIIGWPVLPVAYVLGWLLNRKN
jgi:hypothetical protein